MSETLKPRIGFLGVGWIGLHRMQAVLESGVADVVAIADPSPELREKARALAPHAKISASLEELLATPLDGVSIATPSALHAQQTIAALECGVAVFCQKPLGRNADETRAAVAVARRADRRLDVDFSYRRTKALEAVKRVVDSGELGPIYSARLVFHNAYGPDKPWYFDRSLSGGGCLVDLGIHLVDSALWLLNDPRITRVSSALYAKGERLAPGSDRVEDYAVAQLETHTGALIELACSWNLPAGQDAVISAELFGPHGGVSFRNVNGSFYDFVAERSRGTAREQLVAPPDEWGGRMAVAFSSALAESRRFDVSAEQFVSVADILDRIYGRV
jgi:predicted dehydrogenase